MGSRDAARGDLCLIAIRRSPIGGITRLRAAGPHRGWGRWTPTLIPSPDLWWTGENVMSQVGEAEVRG